MSDMPERIWAWPDKGRCQPHAPTDGTPSGSVEYVRSDLKVTVAEAAMVLLHSHTVEAMTAAGKPLDLVKTLQALVNGDSHE